MAAHTNPITEVEISTLFDKGYTFFLSVARNPVDRFYRIGGYTVRLRFAEERLIPLMTPSLAHLEVAQEESADLTICIFDMLSSQDRDCFPNWFLTHRLSNGEIYCENSETYKVCLSMSSLTLGVHILNNKKNVALFYAKQLCCSSYIEKGAPLLFTLHLFLKKKQLQLIHAGAVGNNGKGILIVGQGGRGKSTTALSSVFHGLQYVGDDRIALSLDPPYRAHSLYNSSHLTEQSLDLLKLERKVPSGEKKALIFLQESLPHLMCASVTIRAIVMPVVGKTDAPVLVPVTPPRIVKELTFSTIPQLPYVDRRLLTSLSSIINTLPCFELHVGQDIKKNVQLIQELLYSGVS